MGKKIIGVIAFAAIAVAAGWNYQQNRNDVKLSDLTLADVEALADKATQDTSVNNLSRLLIRRGIVRVSKESSSL